MLYLNQNDYGHVPYMHNTDAGGAPPERRNVGTSGCGLCCTCMAVEHLTVQTLPLEECVRMSEESGANHRAVTDMVILGPLVAERFGLEYRWTTDMQEMLDCLHGGGQVVVNVRAEADGTGIFTNTRHYILAVGAEGDTVCLLDPNYKSGKFKQYEEAGLLRIDEPFIRCSAELLHQEARSETPYHLFKRK